MAKSILYSVKSIKPQRNGGSKVRLSIYELKKNKPEYVGETEFNTASYKGEESEVYTKLKDSKIISQKEFDSNDGYYDSKSKTKVKMYKV